jgi:DNA-binding MarR family transcriptional regulator
MVAVAGVKKFRPGDREAAVTIDADEDVSGVADLMDAADALFVVMRRERSATLDRSGHGISMAQLAVLEPLLTTSELPVGHLASLAGVSVPTCTRMLKQLEARGLVSRQRSSTDERRVIVQLTEDGSDGVAAFASQLRQRQETVLTQLSVGDRVELASQLRRLAALIANSRSLGMDR